ncbi:GGDEF domain-containing protein [Cryptosporangium phraense]|uniref:GGDEF domain-containing protein n=1 Tax=Cryptosporangium phraense TaxID=2593070 RepID=A0A545AHQ4_9ACTN|nr:GGDEF domain-containing protein [Cryptosporangium phraense]TQS40846.1 GGDEF domain-containing protein [Cryptosporangium phraense]
MNVRETVRAWSLLHRVRALFLVFAILSLPRPVVAVLIDGWPPWWARAAVAGGLVLLAPWWIRGFRRQRFVRWVEPLEWAVLAAVSATAADTSPAAGMVFPMMFFRTMYGTRADTIRRLVYLELALVGPVAVRAELDPDFRMLDPAVPIQVAVLTVLMSVLKFALAQHERMVARERLLVVGASAVVAATDRPAIYQTAVDIALGLVGPGSGIRTTLAVGESTTTKIEAAAGAHIDGLVGLRVHLDRMPAGMLTRFRAGEPIYLEGDDCGALNGVAEVPVCQGGLFLVPLRSAKHRLGTLSIGSDRPLRPEIRSSLVTWAAQLATALESQILNEELTHRAFHDPLTGLPNRALVHDRLQAALTAGRDARPVAFLLVDLDGFKQVNDVYGHKAGDELLCSVAGRLSACVRQGDTVGRLGGDEFAVILPGLTDSERATDVAARLVDAVRMPVVADGHLVGVGASVGVAYADPGANLDDLVRAADTAMYGVKATRAGGYAVSAGV